MPSTAQERCNCIDSYSYRTDCWSPSCFVESCLAFRLRIGFFRPISAQTNLRERGGGENFAVEKAVSTLCSILCTMAPLYLHQTAMGPPGVPDTWRISPPTAPPAHHVPARIRSRLAPLQATQSHYPSLLRRGSAACACFQDACTVGLRHAGTVARKPWAFRCAQPPPPEPNVF